MRILSVLILFVIAAFLFYGFALEPNFLVVKNYDLRTEKWSSKLSGLKIAVISDIHAGSNFIDENKIKQIVIQANSQNPDLIILLGDYISPSFFNNQKLRMPLERISESLSGLHARYGVYSVLGNKDEAFDKIQIRSALEKAGIKVLSNEVATLEIENEKLYLLGLQDKFDLEALNFVSDQLKPLLAEGNKKNLIVLVHNPDYIQFVTEHQQISKNLSLVLAGHTHGGQVSFPFIGALIVPVTRGRSFAAGHIREAGADMFITTGIGTSIIPIRFGVTPEISVLTIYPQP